jgi:Gram-negative bacterial TonB protein C-terminal
MNYSVPSLLLSLLLPAVTLAQPTLLKPGKNKYERGTLRDKRPVGRWEYFDGAGRPELTFDYDSSRIIFMRPDTARYWLRVADDWKLVRPARAPRLLGSREHDIELMGRSIRYPAEAIRSQLQGDVLISYVVGPDGRAYDFNVEQSLSPECDQAVWQALARCYNAWVPAVYLGRPTAARFFVLATFRIVDSDAAVKESNRQLAARQVAGTGKYLDHLVVTALFQHIGSR